MGEPFATADDLAVLWRPLGAEEQLRADNLLQVASDVIRAAIPDVDARLTCGTLPLDITKWVACQMTRRVMASPAGAPPLTQQQQSVGSVSAGFTFANPTGDMYLTRSEEKMLGKRRQVAQTISMMRGGWR